MTGAYISLPSSNGKFGVQAALRFSPALFAGKLIMKAVADDDNGNAGMSGNVYDVCILSDWNISRSNSVDLMLFASNDRFSFSMMRTKVIWGGTHLLLKVNGIQVLTKS